MNVAIGSLDPEEAYQSLAADAELITEIEERFLKSQDAWRAWRDEARTAFDFVAGNHWVEDDLDLLKEYNRPSVTFNFTGPTIDTIAGLEIANRNETMYFPRNPGNAMPAEYLSATAKWVRDETDANDEESEAFMDMATCGIGWTETWVDYNEDPDGLIRINRRDPFEIWPDYSSREKNFRDASYLIRIKDVQRGWLKATWPTKEEEISTSRLWIAGDDDALKLHNQPLPSDAYKKKPAGKSKEEAPDDELVRLVEYQYVKYETFVRAKDPYTGNIVEFDPERFLMLQERFTGIGIQLEFVRQVRKKYYRVFACGDVVLEKGPNPCPTSFTYKAMTGKRDRNNNTWYGVVKAMMDPQRWANKWMSQALHIINSNAQGGVMIEEGAVDDARDFEESWTDPSAITWVPDGSLQNQRIQPKPSPAYPAGLESMTKFAIEAIPKVTGLNVELLGMADREQPADLEYQRRQAGVTILNALFNSQSRYRKEHGRLLLYFINTYISDGRLARINVKGTEEFIPIVRQPDTIKYDIVVGEAPSSVNVKERTWAVLEKMFPIMQAMEIPPIPDFLDYVPLPQTLIMAIKKAIKAKEEGQAKVQQQMQQMQMQALLRQQLAAAAKDEASAEKERAEARESAANANIAASPLSVLEKILELYGLKATADKTVSETPPVPPFTLNGILPIAAAVGNMAQGPVPAFSQPVPEGGQYVQGPQLQGLQGALSQGAPGQFGGYGGTPQPSSPEARPQASQLGILG